MATSTLGNGTLVLAGTTSGTTTVTATAVAGTTTLTLPAATDTLVGKATTDTLTNKTLTGAVMNGTLGATTPSTVAATTISASSTATFAAGAAGTPSITTSGDTNTGIFFPAADTIAFAEGGVEAMRLDSAGNMGLGVTPSALWSNLKGIDVGNGSIVGGVSASYGTSVYYNAYYNGTNSIYKATGYASYYGQGGGHHQWFNAPSGTAGTNITFTQAMTLDASGQLGIGTTSPSTRLHLKGASGTTTLRLEPSSSTSIYTQVRGANGDLYLEADPGNAEGSSSMLFTVDGTERARIDSSGNLLVGTTSAGGRLTVHAQSGAAPCYFKVATNGDAGIFFANASNTVVGQVTVNSASTAYVTSSDYRLKENISSMTGALATVAQLNPVTYKWKSDGSDGQGFIAHELQAIVPDAVVGEKDAVNEDGSIKPQGIDTSFLVATLTAAIQEQNQLITQLTARISALESA